MEDKMLTGDEKKAYQRDYMKRKRSNKGLTEQPVRPSKDVRPIVRPKSAGVAPIYDSKTFGYATKDVPKPAWMSKE